MKQLQTNNSMYIAEPWITKKNLAIYLQISVSYVDKLMRQRKIMPKRFGRSVRFKLSEVQATLERINVYE